MLGRKRLYQIARKLTTDQLQQDLTAGDDFDQFSLFGLGHRANGRFLGFYSKAGLRLALEKYGLIKALARRGFQAVEILVDTTDPYLHKLKVVDAALKGDATLGELVVRLLPMRLPVPVQHPLYRQSFPMLAIEWLYLQDPRRSFDSQRPQLPGQDHPGLGLARKVLELLLVICWRLKCAGLLHHPAHFHNAVMGLPVFQFADPNRQARFISLQRDMAEFHLQAASWAVAWGCVNVNSTSEPFVWQPSDFLIPLHRQLKEYFSSPFYQQRVAEQTGSTTFQLDRRLFQTQAAKAEVFIPRIDRIS